MINNINNAASVVCDWEQAAELEREERRPITDAKELFCRCNPAAVSNLTREQFVQLFAASRTVQFSRESSQTVEGTTAAVTETWEVFTAGGETMVAWWKPSTSQGYIAPELQ